MAHVRMAHDNVGQIATNKRTLLCHDRVLFASSLPQCQWMQVHCHKAARMIASLNNAVGFAKLVIL